WRFHLVHHADREIDVTTGLRFHPVEILLSIGIKAGAVYAIGVPALGVVLFEIILNATSMFNHSNLRITGVPDRLIRALLVTPDMHRVHHSVIVRETNSNFSFNLSVWDRVFGTYTPQPRDGHLGMTIGLSEYQKTESWRWLWMLKIPFTRP
ncbi:MAG: sterol desaturase family protein, partial [Bdellovibrionota bacterium]